MTRVYTEAGFPVAPGENGFWTILRGYFSGQSSSKELRRVGNANAILPQRS